LEEHKRRYVATLTPPDHTSRVLTLDERDYLVRAVKRLTPAAIADAYDALVDPPRGNWLTVYGPGHRRRGQVMV